MDNDMLLSFRLPRALAVRLVRAAAREGVSRGEALRQALQAWLDAQEEKDV